MVRKAVFSRDDVVAAGLRVLAEQGLAALSARHVAEELGSSTAPVYSNFATMDELARAVKGAVADKVLDFTSRRFTDNAFLNIGLGVLEFVRQHPALYAAVFMQDGDQCEVGGWLMDSLSDRMAGLPELRDLPRGEQLLLLHQMGIFTHGLAVKICTGLVTGLNFEDLTLLLEDAGQAMTCHALSRPPRTEAQKQLMAHLVASRAGGDDENDQ